MRTTFYVGVALAACVIAGSVVIFAAPRGSGQLTLENKTAENITKAMIEVSRETINFTNIGPGERRIAKFKVAGDSHYTVSITFQSGRTISDSVGYVTSGAHFDDTLAVEPDKVLLQGGPVE